jgi:hypothetical protein
MNQAIFKHVFVRLDLLEGEEDPFSADRSLGGSNPGTRTRRPNNGQDPRLSGGLGSNVIQMVHLVGQLSNPSAALGAVFEARPDEPIKATACPEPPLEGGRLGNGVVQRAVVKVLALAQGPLTVLETQAAVVDLLGHPDQLLPVHRGAGEQASL